MTTPWAALVLAMNLVAALLDRTWADGPWFGVGIAWAVIAWQEPPAPSWTVAIFLCPGAYGCVRAIRSRVRIRRARALDALSGDRSAR